MKTFIKTIHGISGVLRSSQSTPLKVNYKSLNRYILTLNQCSDFDEVFEKTFKFLKYIFSDTLFAFAISQTNSDEIRVAPVLKNGLLQKFLNMKRGDKAKLKIHYPDIFSETLYNESPVNSDSGRLYDLSTEKHGVELYIMLSRPINAGYRKTLNIIARPISTVLSNINKISDLENAAAMDQLTGCYNRWGFDRLISHDIDCAHRYKRDLSIIMFDIDHFKKVNDTFGHQTGDEVLKKICELSIQHIRRGDYLARIGGEEFVVVLPETKLSKAIEIAERLRKGIETADIFSSQGECINVSASFGAATVKPGEGVQLLLREADMMLYKAKNYGRNRVFPEPDKSSD